MDARIFLGQFTQTDLRGLADNTPLGDLDGWDSLKTVRLVLLLEEITGRSLSENDIEHLRSIGDVQKFLQPAA